MVNIICWPFHAISLASNPPRSILLIISVHLLISQRKIIGISLNLIEIRVGIMQTVRIRLKAKSNPKKQWKNYQSVYVLYACVSMLWVGTSTYDFQRYPLDFNVRSKKPILVYQVKAKSYKEQTVKRQTKVNRDHGCWSIALLHEFMRRLDQT